MEIKPAYVTFEQAKLLKEKEFNLSVSKAYIENQFVTPEEANNWNKLKRVFTKEGYECFGCKLDNITYFEGYSAPEQWQVIEWLRIKHGIWIVIIPTITSAWTYKTVRVIGEVDNEAILGLKSVSDLPPYKDVCGYDYSSPQEAYLAAFDHILTNL